SAEEQARAHVSAADPGELRGKLARVLLGLVCLLLGGIRLLLQLARLVAGFVELLLGDLELCALLIGELLRCRHLAAQRADERIEASDLCLLGGDAVACGLHVAPARIPGRERAHRLTHDACADEHGKDGDARVEPRAHGCSAGGRWCARKKCLLHVPPKNATVSAEVTSVTLLTSATVAVAWRIGQSSPVNPVGNCRRNPRHR